MTGQGRSLQLAASSLQSHGGAGLEILLDEPLARHTSFCIGGPADAFIAVREVADLARVVEWCAGNGVPLEVLGRGTNVLVSDQGFGGVVLRLDGRLARVSVAGQTVEAGGGALLDTIVDAAEEHGLAGAEFLAGIPGTVGGGIRTNAGTFGHSLAELIESVEVMDREGATWLVFRDQGPKPTSRRDCHGRGRPRTDAGVGAPLHEEEPGGEWRVTDTYRNPVVPTHLIVLRAALRLRPGRPESAQRLRQRRRQKHPAEPSAGSFFRNPPTEPAGRLIERCGLKGRSAGGARVSEKHANFIVNRGNARFQDVYELAEVVKASVEEMTGVQLEEEVQILPGFRVGVTDRDPILDRR